MSIGNGSWKIEPKRNVVPEYPFPPSELLEDLGVEPANYAAVPFGAIFDQNLVDRLTTTEQSLPEEADKQIRTKAAGYLGQMLGLMGVARALGQPKVELTVPYFDKEKTQVQASLSLVEAVLAGLGYSPLVQHGATPPHEFGKNSSHMSHPLSYQRLVIRLMPPRKQMAIQSIPEDTTQSNIE